MTDGTGGGRTEGRDRGGVWESLGRGLEEKGREEKWREEKRERRERGDDAVEDNKVLKA